MTFAEQIRRDLERLRSQGYEVREYTEQEIERRLKAMKNVPSKAQVELPEATRIEQVKLVDEMVLKKGIYKFEACEVVGINYGSYKRYKARMEARK